MWLPSPASPFRAGSNPNRLATKALNAIPEPMAHRGRNLKNPRRFMKTLLGPNSEVNIRETLHNDT
jgi:hypothetical protein